MSYLVFARKWRPGTFEEVLAQDHVTVTLRNAIDSGRIGHAYLFTGPRGIGKTTTARILAKALNCAEGPTSTPCQKCDACVQIGMGTHLDVLEIDGASNRGIDEIRELRENARYATATGRYKIHIIDEVHMLTREAFNALLKILEEPPEFVVFIFATTEPRKVPATIVSRCQRFDFRRIPVGAMAEYIGREAANEGIEIEEEALRMVCRASGGSMRDALSLMDQLVSFASSGIRPREVAELLGLVEIDLLADLAGAILGGEGSRALELVDSAMDSGYDVEELCGSLLRFLRNVLLRATGAETGPDELSEAERELVGRVAGNRTDLEVLNVMRIMGAAASEARYSSVPRIVFESAVLASARLGDSVLISSLPEGSGAPGRRPADAAETGAAGGPEAAAEAATEPEGPAVSEPDGSREESPGDGDVPERACVAESEEDRPGTDGDGDDAEPTERSGDADDGSDREKTQMVLDLLDAVGYENSDG